MLKQVPQLAKKARVYDGTAWQELASAQTDLTAYSTTAQMNTAITDGVGLVPILTQTIGTAVTSVIVTSAFSATYDNYLINVSDTAFSLGDDNVGVQMRTGSTTSTTGYYYVAPWTGYNTTPNYTVGSNQSTFRGLGRGLGTGEKQSFGFVLYSPFLASKTTVNGFGYVGAGLAGPGCGGYHNIAASYDQIVISCLDGGNFTGGTIRVYGYKN